MLRIFPSAKQWKMLSSSWAVWPGTGTRIQPHQAILPAAHCAQQIMSLFANCKMCIRWRWRRRRRRQPLNLRYSLVTSVSTIFTMRNEHIPTTMSSCMCAYVYVWRCCFVCNSYETSFHTLITFFSFLSLFSTLLMAGEWMCVCVCTRPRAVVCAGTFNDMPWKHKWKCWRVSHFILYFSFVAVVDVVSRSPMWKLASVLRCVHYCENYSYSQRVFGFD